MMRTMSSGGPMSGQKRPHPGLINPYQHNGNPGSMQMIPVGNQPGMGPVCAEDGGMPKRMKMEGPIIAKVGDRSGPL